MLRVANQALPFDRYIDDLSASWLTETDSLCLHFDPLMIRQEFRIGET